MRLKLRISEMMNELTEESVALEERAVSAEAVEWLVLEALGRRQAPRRGRKTILRSLLVAAVMTVLLSVAVLAGSDLRDIWRSPELQAAAEWAAYVKDKGVEYQEGDYPDPGQEAYGTYDWFGCCSQEMVDEMKAMAQRYDLTLPGMWYAYFDTVGTFYRTVGAADFLPAQRGRAAYTWYLDDGSFDVLSYNGVLCDGQTAGYRLYCLRKGSFHPMNTVLFRLELKEYALSRYTGADGTEVLLYLGESRCLAVTELDRCMVVVQLDVGTVSDHNGRSVDEETLQQFVDGIGFQVIDGLMAP